uniref:Sodium bicarbonate cotransporter 3 n=1 Tax=Schistocephalus solidus TaxID=70667 RepID=A0A0X3P9I9_SCHSO
MTTSESTQTKRPTSAGNTSSIFSEITQLEFGECPPGGINITLSLGQTSPGYWSEKARYIVYEEQYDEVNKQFNPPQYMSISYKHFAHLCRAFRSDLRIISSEADSAENVMDEIASHIVLENGVENDINARQLRSLLLAQRWHPQVNKSYFARKSLIADYERKQSILSLKTTPELVNKYLSACLPDEAEACCIMTGYMPCLTRSFFYLVRVNSRAQMLGLVEVNAPLRFIVLTLSNLPEEKRFYFHIARCFAALMQEKKFCRAAYRAERGSQLFQAACRFSRKMMILPSHPAVTAGDGIPVSPSRCPVNFERTDLVFEDYAADYAASIQQNSVDDDKEEIQPPPRCSVSFCRRFFPPFKELVKGIRVLAERMPSDYIDAFKKDNVGTMLSSILFIYFVVFGPAITFGNLMLTEVNPAFTISLNIFAAGISTVIYALFAGQPLGSIGPSGPGFIFETIIASFARSTGADFFILRFWVGIYAAIVGVILISLNLSSLASYARRSLEELFSSFICIFLILKAIFTMFKVGTVSTVYAVSLTSSFCRLRTMLVHLPALNAHKACVSSYICSLACIHMLQVSPD